MTERVITDVSESDETMDRLIQEASLPNLAALMRKAKASGVLTPTHNYEGAAPRT